MLDLKETFHLLRLSEDSKRYCSILSYFGSTSYIYQRMPKGLNILLSIWQSYINAELKCLWSRKYFEAIMDDLLLFTPTKRAHMSKLEDLLKALLKMDLRYPRESASYSKIELQYMGNVIFIKDRKVCVRP